jgi:hypothetical protein
LWQRPRQFWFNIARLMAGQITAAHPASAILKDPLREEARRNRRALLAVASVCIAVRITDAFPTQISALGITFSSTNQRSLIAMVALSQIYLALVFIVSATADFLLWRHEMRQEFETYLKLDEASKRKVLTLDSAVVAAVDEHKSWRFKILRAEAPADRINHELERYMAKKNGLCRMLLNTYRYALVHHLLLLWFPVLLSLVSFGCLVSWLI